MNYTKGKWGTAYHADGKYSVVVNPKGHPSICRLNETVPEAAANADLIASAPDMYEALKKIADYGKKYPSNTPFLTDINDALAKAEGKA